MIKVIPNQAVCKHCMAKLEYESSDVIETTTKYPNIEFEPDNRFGSSLMEGNWVVNGKECTDYIAIEQNNDYKVLQL